MKPTYLYVKTHRITGLKYFGKTTKTDPTSYKGSGIYWRKHIEKYGNLVDTEILGLFLSQEECIKFATEFSTKFNIIESKEWANLKLENGLDGSPPGVKFSDEHKEKIRKSRLGKCYNAFTDETREKMSDAAKLRIQKQIESGKSAFKGEAGSILAKERTARLSAAGKHNFQVKGFVSVVNKEGVGQRIPKEQYDSQIGPQQDWEFVSCASKEAQNRKKSS